MTEARRAKNVYPEMREARYTIDARDVLAVDRELRGTAARILGFYHSHPNDAARPSALDVERAWPWYVYVILSVGGGEPDDLTAWVFDEDRKAFRPARLHIA